MKVCVFAGTFDPLTKGHAFVIEKCLEMFDKVVVAVGVNVDKKPMFTAEQRIEMIGKTYEVLVEDKVGNNFIAKTDSSKSIKIKDDGSNKINIGSYINVKIKKALTNDLIGEIEA